MKKGFTLIELLAVIVILAVIALIATPAVLNTIEDSKAASAEVSARNIVSAAKTQYLQNIMVIQLQLQFIQDILLFHLVR